MNLEDLERTLELVWETRVAVSRLIEQSRGEPRAVTASLQGALGHLVEATVQLRQAASADPDPQRTVVG